MKTLDRFAGLKRKKKDRAEIAARRREGTKMAARATSLRFVDEIQCTDTPQTWTAGYLLAPP